MIWAKIEQNGSGLAIQIPDELAQECGLEAGSEVRLVKFLGGFRVMRKDEEHATIEELAAKITPENRHDLVDWGPPVGRGLVAGRGTTSS